MLFVRTRVLVVLAVVAGVLALGGTASADSGAFDCNGTYGGTLGTVIIPQGASCTLLAGAAADGVVVEPHATLNASDITINGRLLVYGTATVCGSTLGHVVGDGGVLELGGSNCDGNTISGSVATDGHWTWITIAYNQIGGNLLLRRDKSVIVYGNSVRKDLFLLGDHGTVVVVENSSGHDLSVLYSGSPTLVAANTAKHDAICQHDKYLIGEENTAGHHNSCPAGTT